MNLPNKLTVIRILLAPIFLLLLLWEFPFHNLTAGLVFGAAALTDMFDGKIARSRGLITNLGKFLDPLADKMLTTAAFLGFLAAGRLDVWAVMIILTREFMVTSVRLVAAKDGTVIAASPRRWLSSRPSFTCWRRWSSAAGSTRFWPERRCRAGCSTCCPWWGRRSSGCRWC